MSTGVDRTRVPPTGPPRPVRLPPVERHTLANGLRVLVVEQHELPVVDVTLVTRAGATADLPAFAGRAALAADLLDEGTTTRSTLDIAEQADRLGASLYTRASWDETIAGLHVLVPRLEPALELLIDVALRPAFAEAEVERKRRERLAAIVQEQDEPRVLASNAFTRALYGDAHPFGAPIGGTAGSVGALERDQLAAFHENRQRPGNAFLVVVGDVRVDRLVSMLERAVAGWSDAPVAEDVLPPAPDRAPTSIRIVDRPGAPQSELRIGHTGAPRGTPDYFALQVLNTILGGAFTSRLNTRLRQEKGFTYGAGSGFALRRHGGPFAASSAVFTGATAEAVSIVLQELRRIAAEPVGTTELERAQEYLALGLPRRFETTGDIARHIAEQELYGLGDNFYSEYVARVRAVGVADVRSAAERHIDASAATVVIAGDRAAVQPALEALDAGPVTTAAEHSNRMPL